MNSRSQKLPGFQISKIFKPAAGAAAFDDREVAPETFE